MVTRTRTRTRTLVEFSDIRVAFLRYERICCPCWRISVVLASWMIYSWFAYVPSNECFLSFIQSTPRTSIWTCFNHVRCILVFHLTHGLVTHRLSPLWCYGLPAIGCLVYCIWCWKFKPWVLLDEQTARWPLLHSSDTQFIEFLLLCARI